MLFFCLSSIEDEDEDEDAWICFLPPAAPAASLGCGTHLTSLLPAFLPAFIFP
jgi:hypothetical protein